MPHFSLSAVGADRPGIVAAVSGALMELGGNLEDSTMTILQGHFAILLVVSTGDDVTAPRLEAALAPVAERFELTVAVRLIDPPPASGVSGTEAEPWTISVHGTDRTGIVHRVTAALAEEDGNVVDLATHLVGTPQAPVYVMTLRVTLPASPDAAAAADRIRRATETLGLHCTVHRDESETL